MMKLLRQNLISPFAFILFLILIALWHLWSLTYSPLPWYDETFFASITKALIEGNGFNPEICPIKTNGREVLTYGPIYFLLTSASTKIMGMGIFSFRIINLLFGALSIVLFYNIQKKVGVSPIFRQIVTLLIIFDVIFLQNSHSGRMDLVALFFALWAYLAYFSKENIQRNILMAATASLALLTTPRIAVLVVPLFLYALAQSIIHKKWQTAGILSLLPLLIYSIWIFYAFGSPGEFISYYIGGGGTNDTETNNNLMRFIGGNLYLPFYQWPMIVSGGLAATYLLIHRSYKEPVFLCLLPIFFFYVLVLDTGAYSAIVVPFWYLLVAMGLQYFFTAEKNRSHSPRLVKAIPGLLISLIFVFNTGIFVLKSITIAGTLPERNPAPLDQWLDKHLPEGDKVVGDDRYYYACIKKKCQFQYIDRTESNQQRALFHKNLYRPDWLFISSQTTSQTIDAYKKHFIFEQEYHYTPPATNQTIQNFIDRLPMPISSSYKGTLIKVQPKN